MFCPTCRDEFRAGFTRCERCQVDLVNDLSELDAARSKTKTPPLQAPVVMADYCGFFSMQEAAHAREQLRRERIFTEIVLREPPDPNWDAVIYITVGSAAVIPLVFFPYSRTLWIAAERWARLRDGVESE